MLRQNFRPVARAAKQQLHSKTPSINFRFQSTASQSTSNGTGAALIGGLAGGTVAGLTGYIWYQYSGIKKVVDTSQQTKAYFEQAKQKIIQKAPEPNEAFRFLRDTVKSYAVFIPGARGYVDTAFDDLEKIRTDHGDEFDKIVSDAYSELRDLTTKEEINTASAYKALEILQQHSKRLFDLAGDAAENLLDNHPQVKEKIGGSYDELKKMGDAYGPRAKEEVNQTWEQISSIVQRGASAESAEEIKNLIQEKTKKLQKFGDEAWQKGYEESKQYLEKSPKLKQLIEDNSSTLKKGNFKNLWGMVKESASSGKTEDVEKYVKDKVDQAKQTDSDSLSKGLDMIPGGSNMISQLQSLQTIVQKKGSEAENVLKDTLEELQDVLKKRKEQVEKIAEEGKKQSK
ncbi:hypothetical protein N7454_007341 [Penicillium verhagenii]|nr:hypothetical protein N7454_007341 [Penicillium verhagenii]